MARQAVHWWNVAAGCAGKVAFETQSQARAVAKRRAREAGARQAYRCRTCGKWHVGAPIEVGKDPGDTLRAAERRARIEAMRLRERQET